MELSLINAVVNTSASVRRLEQRAYGPGFRAYRGIMLGYEAIQDADIVILACPLAALRHVLRDTVFALQSKTIVSLVGGATTARIFDVLYGAGNNDTWAPDLVLRATTNIAARRRAAVTLMAQGEVVTPEDWGRVPAGMQTLSLAKAEWLFSRIGTVRRLPEEQLDAASALGSSTTTFFARFLEAVVAGSAYTNAFITAEDVLHRKDAMWIATQAVKGALDLIVNESMEPTDLVNVVAAHHDSTRAGLKAMEKRRVGEGIEHAVEQSVRFWSVEE